MCSGALWDFHHYLHYSVLNGLHLYLNRLWGACSHEQALAWLVTILLYACLVLALSYAIIDTSPVRGKQTTSLVVAVLLDRLASRSRHTLIKAALAPRDAFRYLSSGCQRLYSLFDGFLSQCRRPDEYKH